MSAALVLLSGGQDSTTCLYWAKTMFDRVYALSIFYGQRHETELEAARSIADLAGVVKHHTSDFPVLSYIGDSALLNTVDPIEGSGGYADAESEGGLPTSFVPGRNLLFLGIAGAWAVSLGVKDIVTGVCETDFSGYPDCRRVFVDAMEQALTLAMPSESGPLRLHTPLMNIDKRETVDLARRLPGCWDALAHTVTCYHGARPGCGTCPACKLRAQGFAEAGETDPAKE
jgi:7-cyano-7-deazaguanine synthase